MPFDTKELMEAVSILAEHDSIRVTVKSSMKGALITGASTFVGGLLGGAVGIAIGGTVGAVSAAIMSDEFKPLGQVIKEDMSARQRKALQEKIVAVLANVDVTDAVALLPLLLGNEGLKIAVLNVVRTFITKELGMRLAV